MIIRINKDCFVENLYIRDAEEEIEITEQQAKKIFNSIPIYFAWKYDRDTDSFSLVPLLDDDTLRKRRVEECFNILETKSKLWYDFLTTEQYTELTTWYKSWLDVTKTKIIPKKPGWLE